MNTIIIAGNLGHDPEERQTPSGQKVTSFRMAVRTWHKGAEDTIWYRCTWWGEPRGVVKHLKKGSGVIVTGDLQKPEIYTDRNGQPQVGLEVTANDVKFIPGGKKSEEGQQQQPFAQASSVQVQQPAPAAPAMQAAPRTQGLDDDLPF